MTRFRSLDSSTRSSSRALSSSCSVSAAWSRSPHSSVEWSRAYSRSSSLQCGIVVSQLHSRARSSVSLQPFSSSDVLTFVELHSPLDAVTTAQSTGMYYRRLFPSAAPSRPVLILVHLCWRATHPSMDAAAGVGPHGVAGVLFSRGCTRMRPLQWHLNDRSPMVGDQAVQIPQMQGCIEMVRWWLQEDRWLSGVPIQVPPPSLLLYTNALLSGWGLHLLDLTASRGRQHRTLQCAWDEGIIAGSICLPASAVWVECHPDGRQPSVVASLQQQGNAVSRVLCFVASEITMWIEWHSVCLSARCIPGRQDVLAAQLSCSDQVLRTGMVPSSEGIWGICGVFAHPQVTLFPTQAYTKLPLYMSRYQTH